MVTLAVSQMLLLVAAGTTPYEPEELARICAADLLAERDVRRLAAEWSDELDAMAERQWEPWRRE
jgi:hypothetical protein